MAQPQNPIAQQLLDALAKFTGHSTKGYRAAPFRYTAAWVEQKSNDEAALDKTIETAKADFPQIKTRDDAEQLCNDWRGEWRGDIKPITEPGAESVWAMQRAFHRLERFETQVADIEAQWSAFFASSDEVRASLVELGLDKLPPLEAGAELISQFGLNDHTFSPADAAAIAL